MPPPQHELPTLLSKPHPFPNQINFRLHSAASWGAEPTIPNRAADLPLPSYQKCTLFAKVPQMLCMLCQTLSISPAGYILRSRASF